ncbi:uncharacterized protein A4U43_C06F18070 [Asparagus officinalis]|uniref:Uncharacterized protein n=1 Tax=Asparagus officinalis TaxID=4686 RepID=A0A5P1EMK7_ASPOF|nr:uncharacterized protein A4U43_C06F18070 [Asparagus officinalis]
MDGATVEVRLLLHKGKIERKGGGLVINVEDVDEDDEDSAHNSWLSTRRVREGGSPRLPLLDRVEPRSEAVDSSEPRSEGVELLHRRLIVLLDPPPDPLRERQHPVLLLLPEFRPEPLRELLDLHCDSGMESVALNCWIGTASIRDGERRYS